MRRPTTPPPFGQRIQTLGIPVLFAVASQCTISRFHGPDLAGTRPGPLYFNDARVPGAHDAGNNACRICWNM
jgi:hypothetical protein